MMPKETDDAVSSGTHNSSLVPAPSSPQPFIFQQYTFREIITPTKQGNVSMREVSLGIISDGKSTPSLQYTKGFSFSLNNKIQEKMSKDFEKTLCQLPSLSATRKPIKTNRAVEKLSNLRSRSKTSPPVKKLKVDSIYDQNVSKEERPSEKRGGQKQNPPKLHQNYICIISLIPVIILLGISFYILGDKRIQIKWNVNHLQSILNKSVFGQKEAILSLANVLETTVNKDLEINKEMPIILITGPSGVGKSYTSSIIANSFPPPGISDIILFPLPEPNHIIQKCSDRGYNFIVLDSLDHKSMNGSLKWVKKFLNEALWQNKPIIVMLIFNIQVYNNTFALKADETSQDSLEAKGNLVYSHFKKNGLETFHVHFKSLSEDDVESCVKAALEKKGLEKDQITDKHVNMIKSGIDFKEDGCKRVWSRTASAVFD